MGSIRRRLIGLLFLAPSTASAEVCDRIRPDWSGETVTALSEAIWLFSTIPALALIIATALTIRFRSAWGGVAVVVAWSVLTYLYNSDAQTLSLARAEGCIGPQTLSIGLVIAICIGTVLMTAPRKARPE